MNAHATGLADVDRALGDETPLPRENGELVFEEPWQGRALGMGVVVLERTGASWAEFRGHLVAAIAARRRGEAESEASAYYAAWLDALEALLADRRPALATSRRVPLAR
ncbi:MAG: nitrile hydratase accessory protein [Actinomycetota bacterium]|nr:nitrile hydratase accessory protein [Actinomycetota bacterium]